MEYVNVYPIREKKDAVVIMYNPVGTRRKGYKLSGLKVLVHPKTLNQIEKTTRAKLELLANQVARMYEVKRIRTKRDLTVFVNMFVDKYNPYILFNGTKEFNAKSSDVEIKSSVEQLIGQGWNILSKKYYKKRLRRELKNAMKKSTK